MGLVALATAAAACLDTNTLDSPEAPAGAKSALIVRTCGAVSKVEAYDLPLPTAVHVETCESVLDYWIGYLPEPLSALQIESGPQDPRGCESSGLICCREVPLPRPPKGWLHRAQFAEGRLDVATRFDDADEWPGELSTFVLARECSCPAKVPRVDAISLPEARVRIAKLAGERLLVLTTSHSSESAPPESRLYETTLSELMNAGFPETPFATIDEHLPSQIVALEDGRYFLGLNFERGHILAGRVGEAPSLLSNPYESPDRESRLIALRPGPDAEPQVATLGRFRGPAFDLYAARGWMTFSRPDLPRGTCTDRFYREQRESIAWVDEDRLLVMPAAQDYRQRVTTTATNTPDGLLQWRNGEVTWLMVDRPEGDCLHGMTMTEGLGLVLHTHAPRVFRLVGETWAEIVAPEVFPPLTFESGLRAVIDLDGGLLYTRGSGVLGLIRDGLSCFEETVTNCRIEQLIRVGDVIVGACDSSGSGREAGLVIIQP